MYQTVMNTEMHPGHPPHESIILHMYQYKRQTCCVNIDREKRIFHKDIIKSIKLSYNLSYVF